MTNTEKLKRAEELVNQVFMDMPDNVGNEIALSEAETLIRRVRLELEVKSEKGVTA